MALASLSQGGDPAAVMQKIVEITKRKPGALEEAFAQDIELDAGSLEPLQAAFRDAAGAKRDEASNNAFNDAYRLINGRVNAAGRPGAVQRSASGDEATGPSVHRAAASGIEGGGGGLPHLGAIQRAFGKHDVTGIQAHVGGKAKGASEAMGAEAYATGNHVAFRQSPDLHMAAHEAAHVVQQRAGVQLAGGVGKVGDAYERHADQVADAVVQGKSAEHVLDTMSGRPEGQAPTGSGSIQRAPRIGGWGPDEQVTNRKGQSLGKRASILTQAIDVSIQTVSRALGKTSDARLLTKHFGQTSTQAQATLRQRLAQILGGLTASRNGDLSKPGTLRFNVTHLARSFGLDPEAKAQTQVGHRNANGSVDVVASEIQIFPNFFEQMADNKPNEAIPQVVYRTLIHEFAHSHAGCSDHWRMESSPGTSAPTSVALDNCDSIASFAVEAADGYLN